MPMNPTRALEISDSTPSSMPTPALSTGHTATFFPEIRCASIRSSGVSISTDSVANSFVASYVSRSVNSLTSLRKWTVGVSRSRRYESLCWTSGCVTRVSRPLVTRASALTTAPSYSPGRAAGRPASLSGAPEMPLGDVGREPAVARVQRPLLAERLGAGPQTGDVRAVGERADDDAADLAEVVLVEPAHGRSRRPDANAGGDGRRPLVEGDGVAVHGELDLVEPLLGVLPRPVRRA